MRNESGLVRGWRRVVNTALALWLWSRGRARRLVRRGERGSGRGARPGGDYGKVFIVGCPRSGTTWIRSIMAEHPRVISGPESHVYRDIWTRVVLRSSRPRVLRWAAVLIQDAWRRRNTYGGLQVYVDRRRLRSLIADVLAHPEWSDEQAAEWVIWRAIDDFVEREGGSEASVFVEKTPGHLKYAREILGRFSDACMVEVLRDGRDVCVSMQMLGLTKQWPPSTREEQIRRWTAAVEQGLALQADPELRDRVMSVRYEDVKADPAGQIERLYEFAGLDHDRELIGRVVDATSFAKKKEPTGPGEHSRKGAVGDWRDVFSEEDAEMFRRLAGDLFNRVGYEW